jgi:hypothetical protein
LLVRSDGVDKPLLWASTIDMRVRLDETTETAEGSP